jgi:hypothetical protein
LAHELAKGAVVDELDSRGPDSLDEGTVSRQELMIGRAFWPIGRGSAQLDGVERRSHAELCHARFEVAEEPAELGDNVGCGVRVS